MSEKQYVVDLNEEERARLVGIAQSGDRISRNIRAHAQVLLKVDAGEHGPAWTDRRAAEAFDVHVNFVHSVRKQLVVEGMDRVLERKKMVEPPRKRIFDDTKEKELLAIAAAEPPEGRARWTLQMLADEVVRLEIAPSVSHETVRKSLKKTTCNLTAK